MAHPRLVELHSELLNVLAEYGNTHYIGLRQAAHAHRRKLSATVLRRIRAVDVTLAVMRHVTGASCSNLVAELRSQLASAKPGDDPHLQGPQAARFDPWAAAAAAQGLPGACGGPQKETHQETKTNTNVDAAWTRSGGACWQAPDANAPEAHKVDELHTNMMALELRLVSIERKLGDVAMGDVLRAVQGAAAAQSARSDALEAKLGQAQQSSDILEAQVRALERALAESTEASSHHGDLPASLDALRREVEKLKERRHDVEYDLGDKVQRRAGIDPPPDAEGSQPSVASPADEDFDAERASVGADAGRDALPPMFALMASLDICAARAASRGAWHALWSAFQPPPAVRVRPADAEAAPVQHTFLGSAADVSLEDDSDEDRENSLAALAAMGHPFTFS